MTPAQRLFKRALAEKLAFVPMGASAPQQAAGPGGAPVQPGAPTDPAMAGGAPMDPAAMGGMPPGAPMDPAAMGGMPPMDPAMAGGMPMDPAAMGGMPPMDPAMMGGMPPMDPSAMGGEAPPEPPPAEGGESKASLTLEDSEIVDKITQRTMDIVRQTLEIVGKAKPKAQVEAESAAKQQEAAAGPEAMQAPGPVSGMPGFDPSMIGGPLKTAAILSRALTAKK